MGATGAAEQFSRAPATKPIDVMRSPGGAWVARELRVSMTRGARNRRSTGGLLKALLTVGGIVALSLGIVPTASAASLSLSSPYPAVAVEPGNTASFDLSVTSSPKRRVDLKISGAPDGWTASIRGGGFVVDSVIAGDTSPELKLDVDVPDDAQDGTTRVTVKATAGSDSATLAFDLRVTTNAAGSVSLTSDFPQLQGASTANFNFSLDLKNDTPQDLTFNLTAQGPGGWDVTATPSGQTQAASAKVSAGSSSTISVSAKPPEGVAAGNYPIHVAATAGSQVGEADLEVDVTGNFTMNVSTPNDVLSNRGTAGSEIRQEIDIENTGTAPLENLKPSASSPSGWSVTFDPATIDSIAPKTTGKVTAIIKPAADAITGDYETTITVSNDQANADVKIRTTIETSQIWALIGIALIVVVVVGLFWVFRTYGRR
jgi:uncharacterized membrane protein